MKLLLVVGTIFIQSMLYACGGINQQVYSGKIEYSLDPANPLLCTLTVTLDFDINETLANDSIWINWGDGNVNTLHGTSITEDSVASAIIGTVRIFTHVYTGTHLYAAVPANGYYFISFQNEYRLNGVTNIANGDGIDLPLYLTAQVSIDTSAARQYKPLAFPPLSIGFSGLGPFVENGLQQLSSPGDSITYSLAVPLETVSNPVPEYQYPGQFCIANGSAADTFSMNTSTGAVSWTSACFQGIFAYAVVLSCYRNGQLLSTIMREQNIYVSAALQAGVQPVSANNTLQVYPNPAQHTLTGTVSFTTPAENYLEIVTPDGRVVNHHIIIEDGRFEIDISQLATGIYFLHVPGSGLSEKFVKQ